MPNRFANQLRRDLGPVAAYATLMGTLVGAGIFRVTSEAYGLTGASVILGYVVLAPATLATALPYAVFLSTSLGKLPGAEYSHISRTLDSRGLAFVGAWLKIISYTGALAFLANALADYVLDLRGSSSDSMRLFLALSVCFFFFLIHVWGVRWFGRVQSAMALLLGLSILVLVLPGLFAIRPENYQPFFAGGSNGFLRALPPLFFAFAGFESIAHGAAELPDSTRRLPAIFLRGIALTTLIFLAMSLVSFGVLRGAELAESTAPMSAVASVYLPANLAWIIGFGAILAMATSFNATLLAPSRLLVMLADDGMCPAFLGRVWRRTGTPVVGLALSFLITALLLVAGQISVALNIAVLALVLLYALHSFVLLLLPSRQPELYAERTLALPWRFITISTVFSIVSMLTLAIFLVVGDVEVLRASTFQERWAGGSLTSIELLLAWSVLGLLLYFWSRRSSR